MTTSIIIILMSILCLSVLTLLVRKARRKDIETRISYCAVSLDSLYRTLKEYQASKHCCLKNAVGSYSAMTYQLGEVLSHTQWGRHTLIKKFSSYADDSQKDIEEQLYRAWYLSRKIEATLLIIEEVSAEHNRLSKKL